MKLKILMASLLSISLFACTSKQEAEQAAKESPSPVEAAAEQPEVHGVEIEELSLTNPLNQEWVKNGEKIYDSKCLSCHKLTDEKVVGPGWKGVTQRRKPIWIMNMILNVEIMLDEDPEAQLLLEQCLIRMPNQNLTENEGRQIVEFMRHNDGEK
jgi:hypothetical protein